MLHVIRVTIAPGEFEPMKLAPRDGTPVFLAFDMNGELRSNMEAHRFLKVGTAHPRWYRDNDGAEVAALPSAFKFVDARQRMKGDLFE